LAVTVVSAFNVTPHVTVLADAQPDHEEKTLEPDVAGAVSVKDVPGLYEWEKLVVS
jgi:hypothetical protein